MFLINLFIIHIFIGILTSTLAFFISVSILKEDMVLSEMLPIVLLWPVIVLDGIYNFIIPKKVKSFLASKHFFSKMLHRFDE